MIQKLNRDEIAELKELVQMIDDSPLGKALGILTELAAEGLEARKRSAINGPSMAESAKLVDEDKLIGPERIADILGCSWRHCRETLIPNYGHGVKGSGQGKSTRYLLSDVYRIRDRIVGKE